MFILRVPFNTPKTLRFFSQITVTQLSPAKKTAAQKSKVCSFLKFNVWNDFNQRSSSVVVWVIRHSNEVLSLLPLPLPSKNVLAARPVAIRLDVLCGEALKYLTETPP